MRSATRASSCLLTVIANAILLLSAAGIAGCSSGDGVAPPLPPVPPSPRPRPGSLSIAGNVAYEFPPPNPQCLGLDFTNVELRPIRKASVQLIDPATNIVLDSTLSDDNGDYTLSVAPQTDVFVRVRAELKSSVWDVEVRNNVDTSANPPPLGARPLYVMDSSTINSGSSGQTLDLTATTGWGGLSFTGPRVAAPFAILDAIYEALNLVSTEDPSASFAPLDAYWSPDNSSTRGAGSFDERVNSGEIGTSFYSANRLFLLGRDGDDIEEFDDHVIVHEWGHYFEDNLSRSDSIGGAHGVGDELDMRVAFGEGFATALSGIVLDDPQYCDTLWAGPALSGFRIDIENGSSGTAGWFNELSVLALVYDLWDTNPDGADDSSIGFGPIYDVMTGPQPATSAFTSIFSFAAFLKQQGTGQDTFIDNLLMEHNINPSGIDEFGTTETNDGPGTPDDVLPVYTDITLGNTVRVCANSQFDSGRDGNKLSEHQFLRLILAAPAQLTFTMTAVSPPSTPSPGFDCEADPNDPENSQHSNPNFLVRRNGELFVRGFSCEPNSETISSNGLLLAGEYVIDLNEFRHEDDESPIGFPERMCFDFTASL